MKSRVAIVTSLLPPEQGGPAAQASGLAKYLSRAGVTVDLVLLGPQTEIEPCPGVVLHHVRMIRNCIPYSHYFVAFWFLLRLFVRNRPTLVHSQVFAGPSCLSTILVCRLLSIPAYSKVSSEFGIDKLLKKGGTQRAAKLLRGVYLRDWLVFQLCDKVLATTRQFARILPVKYGLPKSKVRYMPNFSPISVDLHTRDASLFNESRRDYRLVSVGRGIRQKNFDGCVKVAGELHRVGIRFKWHFVGHFDEGYLAELEELATAEGVAHCIVYEGRQGAERIAEILQASDLFVLLSRFEWFGIAVVESMAMGVPVVISNVPGMAEIPAAGGIRVDPDSPEIVARQIVSLLGDPKRRQRMGLAAQARVRSQYSIQCTGEKLLQWVREEYLNAVG